MDFVIVGCKYIVRGDGFLYVNYNIHNFTTLIVKCIVFLKKIFNYSIYSIIFISGVLIVSQLHHITHTTLT